jgi:hypothetical protein
VLSCVKCWYLSNGKMKNSAFAKKMKIELFCFLFQSGRGRRTGMFLKDR